MVPTQLPCRVVSGEMLDVASAMKMLSEAGLPPPYSGPQGHRKTGSSSGASQEATGALKEMLV